MTKAQDLKDLRFHLHHLELALQRRRSLDMDIEGYAKKVRQLCKRTGSPLPKALQRNPAGRAGSGLTAGIRELIARGDGLTAAEIYDRLIAGQTVDVAKYHNPRSVVHNTLLRMVKQGELRTEKPPGYRKAVYRKAANVN